VSSAGALAITPAVGMRPYVGLKQNAAVCGRAWYHRSDGLRTNRQRHHPGGNGRAEPAARPPGVCARSRGLRVGPGANTEIPRSRLAGHNRAAPHSRSTAAPVAASASAGPPEPARVGKAATARCLESRPEFRTTVAEEPDRPGAAIERAAARAVPTTRLRYERLKCRRPAFRFVS